MDIDKLWEEALQSTQVIRGRIKDLAAFEDTQIPYIMLSESKVDFQDTVVRRGKVLVSKPSLFLPYPSPQFSGFAFEEELHLEKDTVVNFLLVRGVNFPALSYRHNTHNLDIHSQPLKEAVKSFSEQLARQEDVDTGLITGPSDCWQFSVLIFVANAIIKSAPVDIQRIWENYLRGQGPH